MSLQSIIYMVSVLNRKEKKMRLKLEEVVSKYESLVDLQKTLEMKQQERQKRKENEKGKSKLNEHMAAQNVKSYNHKKVSTYSIILNITTFRISTVVDHILSSPNNIKI